jgi:hypothetical protein
MHRGSGSMVNVESQVCAFPTTIAQTPLVVSHLACVGP